MSGNREECRRRRTELVLRMQECRKRAGDGQEREIGYAVRTIPAQIADALRCTDRLSEELLPGGRRERSSLSPLSQQLRNGDKRNEMPSNLLYRLGAARDETSVDVLDLPVSTQRRRSADGTTPAIPATTTISATLSSTTVWTARSSTTSVVRASATSAESGAVSAEFRDAESVHSIRFWLYPLTLSFAVQQGFNGQAGYNPGYK